MKAYMLRNYPKKLIKRLLNSLGVEIHRKAPSAIQMSRTSLAGCLQATLKNGLQPATVIDVGAAFGTFELYESFPDAYHILVEPLEEFIPHLRQITDQIQHAEYIIATATNQCGNSIINVHQDLVGSSIYKEDENSNVNGFERTVPAITLDRICSIKKTNGPYLLKLDVQGAELDVLQGAETILHETDLVIMEVSLFKFFQKGPLFYDCIVFMKEKGFVVYDIFEPQYRLLDGAMSQIDMAFVRETGPFRKYHMYATREQRTQQNQKFRRQCFSED